MQRSHNDFNPRAPYGARPLLRPAQAHAPWHFNPRAPYGARLASLGHGAWIYTDFNPRAPYGARHVYARYLRTNFEFQSTRPIRGATPPRSMPWARPLYFNPRAPYGARHDLLNQPYKTGDISIHAPHMGRDKRGVGCGLRAVIFQSTRPIWGATVVLLSGRRFLKFQSTRPIWGATGWLFVRFRSVRISIHAPHMGRDCLVLLARVLSLVFQSTRPIWGATESYATNSNTSMNFNPRAPYGARLSRLILCSFIQSISIHAPHMGRDSKNA